MTRCSLLLATCLFQTAQANEPADADATKEWKPVYAAEVQADSFLRNDWNRYHENYHPNYVADGNPKTAWVEGVPGHGEGQVLYLPLNYLEAIQTVRLRIRNGYQKSQKLLEANSAPKEVIVYVGGYSTDVSKTVTLERRMGWQTIDIPLEEADDVTVVSLEIVSVHPGSKYEDTCISDLEIAVQGDFDYRPAIEAARRDRVMTWVNTRKSTAAYFKKKPQDYPFAATHYKRESIDTDTAALESKIEALTASMTTLGEAPSFMFSDAPPLAVPLPDGFEFLAQHELGTLWVPTDATWQPIDEPWSSAWSVDHTDAVGWSFGSAEYAIGHFKAALNDAGRPTSLWRQTKETHEGRGTSTHNTTTYVVLNEHGRATTMLDYIRGTHEEGGKFVMQRVREMAWTPQHQLHTLTVHIKSTMFDYDTGEPLDEHQYSSNRYVADGVPQP